jgi:hypothetical protein
MRTFKILLPNGQMINQLTVVNGKRLTNEVEICKLLKNHFCRETKVKSFAQWANELNETGEYEGKFTKLDALDTLASQYTLNIDGNHIDIYKFFLEFLPFKS